MVCLDNQCPGEPGYGVVDEISGTSGFSVPGDKNAFCWQAQAGATEYGVVRSPSPRFSGICPGTITTATCWSPPDDPAPGVVYYFLVRATAPYPGSWGQDSSGTERQVACH